MCDLLPRCTLPFTGHLSSQWYILSQNLWFVGRFLSLPVSWRVILNRVAGAKNALNLIMQWKHTQFSQSWYRIYTPDLNIHKLMSDRVQFSSSATLLCPTPPWVADNRVQFHKQQCTSTRVANAWIGGRICSTVWMYGIDTTGEDVK